MRSRETLPLPGPDFSSREEFLNLMCSDRTVAYVTDLVFKLLTEIHYGKPLASGCCSFIAFERDEGGKPVGIEKVNLFVNEDYYRGHFSQSYLDIIPYEIEHEAQELYYASKRGMNAGEMSRRLGHSEFFGLAHYLAIKRSLERVHREGMLDKYMKFKKEEMEAFDGDGHPRAKQELEFYRRYAEKLKTKRKYFLEIGRL